MTFAQICDFYGTIQILILIKGGGLTLQSGFQILPFIRGCLAGGGVYHEM